MQRETLEIMLKDQIPSHIPEVFDAFCRTMHQLQYGQEETCDAWFKFVAGFDAGMIYDRERTGEL